MREKLPVPPLTVAVATIEVKLSQEKIRFTIEPFYLGDRFMIFKSPIGGILGTTLFGKYAATINCRKRLLQFPEHK